MDDILTLFYMKKSGVIKCFCSGKQTLDYYGEEKVDVEPLMGFIYVNYDEFLINNLNSFRVLNGKVEMVNKPTIKTIK